jgi:mRNA interferase RelE/StbE
MAPSVNMDIRFTWEYLEEGIILRNIGHYDETLNNP